MVQVGGQHGAGGVDGVAALHEDAGAGGSGQGLAGDGQPVPAVQHRFFAGPLREGQSRRNDDHDQREIIFTFRLSVSLLDVILYYSLANTIIDHRHAIFNWIAGSF